MNPIHNVMRLPPLRSLLLCSRWPLVLVIAIGVAVLLPRSAIAQIDSVKVARSVDRAEAELDAARHTADAPRATVRRAEVAYAMAMADLRERNYRGAAQFAQIATRLARRVVYGRDSVPSGGEPAGAEHVGPGVPAIHR